MTQDDSNKREYVELIARQRLTESVKDQVSALVSGFYEIVPKDLIGIFAPNELQLLISGRACPRGLGRGPR